MRFEVDARKVDAVTRDMQLFFSDQIPFVTGRAVNRTALDFQADQREHMSGIFEIRREGFLRRSVKVMDWATPAKQEARVKIDSPGDRSDIFGKFEADRTKDPLGGSVAVPTEHVPRTPTGVIRAPWRPRRVLDRNFRGGFRAFIRKRGSGKRAIYFDQGDRIVPLYWLVDRVEIEPNLQFVQNANRTVDRRWQDNFATAFDQAIGLRSSR